MSLAFLALQCFSCDAFQVQQAKKVPKWCCVLCGSKQSVRKIFAKSASAKDVRTRVQQLNMARGELAAASTTDAEATEPGGGDAPMVHKATHQAATVVDANAGAPSSRWSQYLDDVQDDGEASEEHAERAGDVHGAGAAPVRQARKRRSPSPPSPPPPAKRRPEHAPQRLNNAACAPTFASPPAAVRAVSPGFVVSASDEDNDDNDDRKDGVGDRTAHASGGGHAPAAQGGAARSTLSGAGSRWARYQ